MNSTRRTSSSRLRNSKMSSTSFPNSTSSRRKLAPPPELDPEPVPPSDRGELVAPPPPHAGVPDARITSAGKTNDRVRMVNWTPFLRAIPSGPGMAKPDWPYSPVLLASGSRRAHEGDRSHAIPSLAPHRRGDSLGRSSHCPVARNRCRVAPTRSEGPHRCTDRSSRGRSRLRPGTGRPGGKCKRPSPHRRRRRARRSCHRRSPTRSPPRTRFRGQSMSPRPPPPASDSKNRHIEVTQAQSFGASWDCCQDVPTRQAETSIGPSPAPASKSA